MAAPLTRNLTILFTDLKGFTEKTSAKSRADLQGMLTAHHDLVLPVLEGKGGKLIKTIGDAFLMVFDSPTDAVLAGVAVQEKLAAYNADKAENDRIDVRVAINLGEVVLTDNDVYGEAVNIAARIEGVAVPGEVFFTEAVYLAMNKAEVPTSEVGLLQLKGIPEKIRAYKVRREQPVVGESKPETKRPIWDRLRKGEPAASPIGASDKARMASPTQSSAPLLKRAGALALDLLFVWIVLTALGGGSSKKVHIKVDPATKKTSVSVPQSVDVGPNGVHIQGGDSKVDIGPEGVSISDQDDEKRGHPLWFPILWTLYGVIFLKRLHGTPGMRIFGLMLIQENGSPIEKRQYWTRSLMSVLSVYAIGLGYLWALFRKDGRTWHDLVAGTKVVASQS